MQTSRRDEGSVAGGKASPQATPPETPEKTSRILKGCEDAFTTSLALEMIARTP
jgi:hypothetical protein